MAIHTYKETALSKRGRPQRVEGSFTKRKNNEHRSDLDITHGSDSDRNSKASTRTMDQSKRALEGRTQQTVENLA